MVDVNIEIIINRLVEVVFSYVMNLDNVLEWYVNIDLVEWCIIKLLI